MEGVPMFGVPFEMADRGKTRALTISLGLHIASFIAMMEAPTFGVPSLPPPSPTEYQQAFKGKEDKIVWYKFRELPNIAPRTSPSEQRPLRAEVKAKQAIISSPPNAPKRNQVVLTPVPELNELPPLDLPNLIAVKLPPKTLLTPPDVVRPEPRKIDVAVPQEVTAPPLEDARLPTQRLPGKPYTPMSKQPPATVKIAAPSEAAPFESQSVNAPKLPATRLPGRPLAASLPQARQDTRAIGLATETATLTINAPGGAVITAGKLPARAYSPPTATTAQTGRPGAPEPPPPFEGNPGDFTVAIAGLNPATTPVALPAASSPAQFSAGQQVRTDGATSDGSGKGLTAPDLFARSNDGTKPNLLARASIAPNSKDALKDALRYGQPVMSTAAPTVAPAPRANAVRVSSAPDPRFNGRDIYMMAIQMPNLTSYSGSWLMWYADRTARQAGLLPIAAPVAHRKVDPKYIAAAVDEHIEGRVQLYCVIGREGQVTGIQLLRGIDDRLNRSAEEALSKWEFYPATRDGQPVDVDVVVEIPFVLAPRAATKP